MEYENDGATRLVAPIAVLREQMMNCEDTQAIAETLGLELSEYVEMVLEYAMDPSLELELEILDDEAQEALELEGGVCTEREMIEWFEKLEAGTLESIPHLEPASDEYSEAQSEPATGQTAHRRAPAVATTRARPQGSVLRDQLLSRQRMDARRAAVKNQI